MPRKPAPKKPARKAAGHTAKKPVKAPPRKPEPKKAKKAARPKRKAAPVALEALTYRQRQFIHYYTGEAKGNGTAAARLAGYASPNVEAARLLANASIRAAISAKAARVALSQDEVLARLSDIASADIGPFLVITRAGEPSIDLRKLKRAGLTHLIRKIKPTAHGIVIELHDAVRTLDLLGKYHGLFGDGAKDERPAEGKPRLTIPDKDDRRRSGS